MYKNNRFWVFPVVSVCVLVSDIILGHKKSQFSIVIIVQNMQKPEIIEKCYITVRALCFIRFYETLDCIIITNPLDIIMFKLKPHLIQNRNLYYHKYTHSFCVRGIPIHINLQFLFLLCHVNPNKVTIVERIYNKYTI